MRRVSVGHDDQRCCISVFGIALGQKNIGSCGCRAAIDGLCRDREAMRIAFYADHAVLTIEYPDSRKLFFGHSGLVGFADQKSYRHILCSSKFVNSGRLQHGVIVTVFQLPHRKNVISIADGQRVSLLQFITFYVSIYLVFRNVSCVREKLSRLNFDFRTERYK